MRVVVASRNPHKVAELRHMIQHATPKAEVVSMEGWGEPPEVEETGETFAANAQLKARGIGDWLAEQGERGDTWVLADDSGICVDALEGGPGVRSARFGGEPPDDAANNRKLVGELKARGLEASPAHYACVLAMVRVDGGPVDGDGALSLGFSGRWDVEVRVEARGRGGFGYDPHAWLEGEARTVAELRREEKAEISHRGRAMAALVEWLRGRGGG